MASVRRFNGSQQYWFDEGCFINDLSNSVDDESLSIALATVPAGTTTAWHWLEGITERYVIQQGEGIVEIGDAPPQLLRAHDVVIIPPGSRQRIANTGNEPLVFLALCTPRFKAEAYHQD